MDINGCLEKKYGRAPLADRVLATFADYQACLWIGTDDPGGKLTLTEMEALQAEIDVENERAQIILDLEASDADMARVSEDLIDAGGDPALLPQAALDKIAYRKALRARLAELD